MSKKDNEDSEEYPEGYFEGFENEDFEEYELFEAYYDEDYFDDPNDQSDLKDT